jgi:hypothetical protein
MYSLPRYRTLAWMNSCASARAERDPHVQDHELVRVCAGQRRDLRALAERQRLAGASDAQRARRDGVARLVGQDHAADQVALGVGLHLVRELLHRQHELRVAVDDPRLARGVAGVRVDRLDQARRSLAVAVAHDRDDAAGRERFGVERGDGPAARLGPRERALEPREVRRLRFAAVGVDARDPRHELRRGQRAPQLVVDARPADGDDVLAGARRARASAVAWTRPGCRRRRPSRGARAGSRP